MPTNKSPPQKAKKAKKPTGAARASSGGNPPSKSALAALKAIQHVERPVSPKGRRYSPDEQSALWSLVIAELEGGKTLNKSLAAVEGAPSSCEFLKWAKETPDRKKQYAEARLAGYEKMADQIIDLSDDCRIGTTITEKADGGVEVVYGDMAARARLQIDSRKWLLSKCLPKIYGDRAPNAGGDMQDLAAQLRGIADRLPV
jgi:hypothetical protein